MRAVREVDSKIGASERGTGSGAFLCAGHRGSCTREIQRPYSSGSDTYNVHTIGHVGPKKCVSIPEGDYLRNVGWSCYFDRDIGNHTRP